MNLFSQLIPQYLLTRRSLTIMVTSAAAFAFLFIIIYSLSMWSIGPRCRSSCS